MPDSPLVLLYDASGQPVSTAFAPVSGRPGQATYSPQGGVTVLGHDYGTSATAGTAYVPRVDKNGNVATDPVTAQQAGVAVSSVSAIQGVVALGMSGLTPTPITVDANGNLAIATSTSPTFTVAATGVALTSGKSLLCLVNKSASSVLRLVSVFAQNTNATATILTAYYVHAQELRFCTGASGGTALTPISWDNADVLATGVTAYTGATVTGEVSPALRRWATSNYPVGTGGTIAEDTTFDQQGRDPWVSRNDPSAKPITIRPGQGLHVKSASTSTNGVQDVTMIFTQAAA